MEKAEPEQIEMPLGPVLLKTKADKRSEELVAALESDVEEMKENAPNMAGYFLFVVDADRTIYSNGNIAKHCPFHSLAWPEMVRNACFIDLSVRPPNE